VVSPQWICEVKPRLRKRSLAADSEPTHESRLANQRGTVFRRKPGDGGMKAAAMLAGVVGICAVGQVGSCPGQSHAVSPYAEIYQRATNEFAEAVFYKPAEPKSEPLGFTLAPLILQEVNGAKEPLSLPDRFGTLSVSNGAPVLDRSRPAIYWEADAVQINGKALARFSYVWSYAPDSLESERAHGITSAASGPAKPGLPLQGIRITLNSAGQPAIWEVLADSSRARLFFVSQNLEAAAMAEFGKPLPGRRFAAERSVEAAPDVVVARVIDDNAVAAGPIVYQSAGTRAVSTLICRCMPAQAKKLLATSTYDLLPFQAASTNSLIIQARFLLQERAAFWPGDDTDGKRLEACLRLPEAFSNSRK
jgi:hypothetical protein